jgi:hypothetical protein
MTQVDANEKANGALKVTAIMETLCFSETPSRCGRSRSPADVPGAQSHRLLLSLESRGWAFRDPLRTDTVRHSFSPPFEPLVAVTDP